VQIDMKFREKLLAATCLGLVWAHGGSNVLVTEKPAGRFIIERQFGVPRVLRDWDWRDGAQEPYRSYAVTVMTGTSTATEILSATSGLR